MSLSASPLLLSVTRVNLGISFDTGTGNDLGGKIGGSVGHRIHIDRGSAKDGNSIATQGFMEGAIRGWGCYLKL